MREVFGLGRNKRQHARLADDRADESGGSGEDEDYTVGDDEAAELLGRPVKNKKQKRDDDYDARLSLGLDAIVRCEEGLAGGAETVEEYVSVSSYGRDFDFYAPSGCVDPGIQPLFTRNVLLFFITTFFVRPACCGAFMTYGRYTSDYRLFDCCLATTVFFYMVLIVESSMLYLNVRQDRMPLGRTERFLAALLEIAGPAAFISGASSIIFGDRRFFERVIEFPRDPAYADSIDMLTAMALMTYLSYSVLAISDVMGFVAPRLWVVAVAKTGVPF